MVDRDVKRGALMDLILTEHRIDRATNEGMPENGRSPRLQDVLEAPAALERGPAPELQIPHSLTWRLEGRLPANIAYDCTFEAAALDTCGSAP